MRGLILAAAAIAALACDSPEATRARGTAGADVGNRTPTIEIHGQVDPGHATPLLGKAAERKAVSEFEPASEKGK